MKVIVTLFWTLAIGQVVGYIMTALAGVPDNALGTLVVSFFFAFFILLFKRVAIGKDAKEY